MRLVAVSALLAGGLLAWGAPAEAVSSRVPAIMALDATGLPGYESTQPRFADGTFTLLPSGSPAGGFSLTSAAAPFTDGWGITLAPPAGQSFHIGYYPQVSDQPTAGQAYGAVRAGSTNEGFLGDIDVLDWAAGPNGLPTRFDIVVQDDADAQDISGAWPGSEGYFGELRLGEPGEGAVHLGSHHLAWPQTAVRSTPIRATEWLHNTSGSAVAVGTPQLSGPDAADWRVSGNRCGAHLAAGATCSMVLGYSPTAGGPRSATLSVPVGGQTQTVSLAGEADLGTSSLTFSGTDMVSGGGTHSFPNGPYVMSAWYDPIWRTFHFAETVPYVAYAPWSDPEVELSSPDGGPLAVGTHATVFSRKAYGTGYGEDMTYGGRGCGDYAGTVTVHAFTADATGAPTTADVDYTQRCTDDPNPAHIMTGRLLWQQRSDTTAPSAPTGLRVASGAVRWTASASKDAVGSIARLEPGTTAGTPTSGLPLSIGTATSAALPALVRGQVYTVEVFAVDATGNVGSPATATVVG
jgi:hypothetical protein